MRVTPCSLGLWGLARKKGSAPQGDNLFSEQEIQDYSHQDAVTTSNTVPKAQKATAPSTAPAVPSDTVAPTGEKLEDLLPKAGQTSRKSSIDRSSVDQQYAALNPEKARFDIEKRARNTVLLLILMLVLYALVVILPADLFFTFSVESFATRVTKAITANVQQAAQVLTGASTNGFSHSNLLIYALVMLVGAALSCCGAAYQGTFQNDLATPSTLGVMSGASMGMVFYLVSNTSTVLESRSLMALDEEQAAQIATQYGTTSLSDLSLYFSQSIGVFYSLAGALLVVFLTVLISKIAGYGKISNIGLVIAGQVFSAVAGAVVTLYRLMLMSTGGQQAVTALGSLQTGDLSGLGNIYDALFLGLPVLTCIVLLCLMAPKLNAIAFGADEARTLGIRVGVLRGVVIGISTLMTALVVSYCGAIGFVGFLIPHMVRRFVGPDFRYLLPASAFAGASFVLVVFYAYTTLTGYQGGIGLVTTCFGAVVFIFTLVKRRQVPNVEK